MALCLCGKQRSHADTAWLESDHLQVLSLSVREQRHRRQESTCDRGNSGALTFFLLTFSLSPSLLPPSTCSLAHSPASPGVSCPVLTAPFPRLSSASPRLCLSPPPGPSRPLPLPVRSFPFSPSPSCPSSLFPQSSVSFLCNRLKHRRWSRKNSHRCRRRRPVRFELPPPHSQCPRGPGFPRWSPRPRSRFPSR